ncbi:uncharacterized protein LOC117650466 [Thrips palmi]|uniref:Uncharacterized protein LOC117650466 n=1 Tax=Thrips palmi TaxID=161013 RepID=A0A6P8ZWP7_THRPL|nr:uncharacterized protein LOC117650466 [Thrips palmi]
MDGDDRLRRASWFNPRLRRYTIKERPKSWVFGNYRKTVQEENAIAGGTQQQQKPIPPAPPVRSPLTRLQSVPSMIQMEVPARNKEDTDSEKRLQGEIINEPIGREKQEDNNITESRNAPNQEKDFVLQI